jgi:CDP-diglyceride synthetase
LRPFPLTFAALGVVAAILLRRRIGLGVVAIAVALAALLAIYGFGVVDLPDAEEAIEDVGTTLGAWTYLLVGSLAFLESAAFVGLVAPGEVAVIFGGIIAGRGDINLFVLIVVVWFAAMAGDLAGYAFGRRVGRVGRSSAATDSASAKRDSSGPRTTLRHTAARRSSSGGTSESSAR